MWLLPNCTLTRGQSFRRSEFFCDLFKLIPTPQSFLFYYNTRPNIPVSWLSLSSRLGNVRFIAFTISYKKLKKNILKFLWSWTVVTISIILKQTKFPFHWTQNPTQLGTESWSSMLPWISQSWYFFLSVSV